MAINGDKGLLLQSLFLKKCFFFFSAFFRSWNDHGLYCLFVCSTGCLLLWTPGHLIGSRMRRATAWWTAVISPSTTTPPSPAGGYVLLIRENGGRGIFSLLWIWARHFMDSSCLKWRGKMLTASTILMSFRCIPHSLYQLSFPLS